MRPEPYELVGTGEVVTARVRVRGSAVLTNPRINRGTAFTMPKISNGVTNRVATIPHGSGSGWTPMNARCIATCVNVLFTALPTLLRDEEVAAMTPDDGSTT